MSKGNGFSKFFKNKDNKVSIPDEAKSQPIPRSKDEIDKEYTQVCINIGDRTVKAEGLKQELTGLFNYVERLGQESAARQQLDQQAAQDQAKAAAIAPVGKDLDKNAPPTTGVDTNAEA